MSSTSDLDFFIPLVSAADTENFYVQLAYAVGARPAPPDRRIYSIEFKSNKDQCRATIGNPLKMVSSAGVADGPLVLAIFPGVPYEIAISSDAGGDWHNPIRVGNPKNIQLFRPR